MRKAFAALAVSAALTTAAMAQPIPLAKDYDVVGTSLDGRPYRGHVAIDILSDSTFAIRWTIGADIFRGFGMYAGDTLAVAFSFGSDQPGLVVYRPQPGGVLQGVWTVRGSNGSGTETLTPR